MELWIIHFTSGDAAGLPLQVGVVRPTADSALRSFREDPQWGNRPVLKIELSKVVKLLLPGIGTVELT